ncbi:hypothetical protein OH76DRAFT_144992 [Lentinus brumalis]|uniref:Uncharacterized protein n=1 Tax=Lentinus brumalis TaxID=2498619 RepID=A0A371CP86_9APHY|nr:hypothetical protein OH76DRAFT_144992 [Polyporus brumalis]
MQRKRDSLDLSGARANSPMRSASMSRERSNSPLASRTHRASLTPSATSATVSAGADFEIDPDREGEETWYGIPFESLVRLTSPNDAGFGMLAPSLRGHDAEIATLYSAASVLSVPRMIRSPVQNIFAQSGSPGSHSPMRSDTIHSRSRPTEENMTIQAIPRSRAAYDVREVAADAIPLRLEPDEVIHGDHGLVRCVMLNDRMHALTVDTAGEVAVWDVVRGACLGRFPTEDVTAASFCGGSDQSVSGAGGSADGRSVAEKHRSPREALETVRERIEGEAVVTSWCSLDTKTGVLTVHLTEKCFEAEIYADEAGYGPERQFSEEARLNIGKWVLRNLFYGFIREEQRQASRRAREVHSGHDASSQHRLQRGSAPTHIDINSPNYNPNPRSRSSSDVSTRSAISQGPRSATIILSPSMLPAVSPPISALPRSSPLMTPMIPLYGGIRDSTSALSPIPQSPNTAEATPLPRGSRDVQKAETLSGPPSSFPPSGSSDYFSLRTRRPSVSTAPTPDDFSGWGSKATTPSTSAPEAGLQTPSTPSMGSLMGRLKAFGKGTRRAASETPGPTTPGGTITAAPVGATLDEPASPPVAKTPAQVLLSGPLSPPSSSEAPSLPIPPNTSILISEEAPSGWHTLYRGYVSSTANDVRQLEESMPMWLLECLLLNKVPTIPVTKLSFVLLPYKEPDGETLPELLNTQQSKLTASRFLRVRKLTLHVQDKLEKIAGGHHSPASAVTTPRSSLDRRSLSSARAHDSRPRADEQYEILCNDTVLPLDMTLAAVRQYVWRRQSAELVMHYRRKTHAAHAYPTHSAP